MRFFWEGGGIDLHFLFKREPYVRLSPHTAPLGPFSHWVTHGQTLASWTRSSRHAIVSSRPPAELAPSLPPHYRAFNATTSQSAPVGRIGAPSLVTFPLHRPDRFPRSTLRPRPYSRRLYAGCRSDSRQVTSDLIPAQGHLPRF